MDYKDTFAPVARYAYIRAIMSIPSKVGWTIHQMHVKTAFLNGEIEEEVYNDQPHGYKVHGRESHICRLKKALYGLAALILTKFQGSKCTIFFYEGSRSSAINTTLL